jgi:hypothetical protein
MAQIELTRNLFAQVDDNDVALLQQFKWTANPTNYGGHMAVTQIEGKTVYMHRLIMRAPTKLDVHHKNHDTLDNRKCNLEIVSRSRNLRKRKSAPKGYHRSSSGAWTVQVAVKNRTLTIGSFATEFEAAQVATEVREFLDEIDLPPDFPLAELIKMKPEERYVFLRNPKNFQ